MAKPYVYQRPFAHVKTVYQRNAPSPVPQASCLSFSVFMCVAGRAYWLKREGGGRRRQIIRWRESLVLYKYSTLSYWYQRTNKQQLWNNLTYILPLNIRGQYVEHTTNVGQRGDTRSKHNISQPEGMKLSAPTSLLGSGSAKHASPAKKMLNDTNLPNFTKQAGV